MSRRARLIKALAMGAAAGLALVLAIMLFLTQTDWGRERVRRITLNILGNSFDGELRIGRIEGDLLERFRLVDVAILDKEGRPFVRADTIVTRLSLPALLVQRIRLTDMRIVHAEVILDKPPSEEWNFARVLKLEDDSTSSGGGRWGRWVSLRDVDIVDSRLMIRTAWDASDELTPAEQQEALAKALAPDSRENIVAVPGGYQNVMDFHGLNAGLGRVLLADPDSAAIIAEVLRMSGIFEPYKPPAAEVTHLIGNFRLARDSLFMADVVARLPGSHFSGEGIYSLESGDLLLRMEGRPASFADLRWLMPELPEEGGGPVKLEVRRGSLTTRVIAQDADMRIGEARIAGKFDVTLGDTVRLQDTDLRFEQVDTRMISRVLPVLEPPRHGHVTGHMILDGTPSSLRLDGDVAFTEPASGTSHVTAEGAIGVNGNVHFSDLVLRFNPLQGELARAAIKELPTRGAITGTARLTGEWKGMLSVDSDLTFRDPRAGPSRVRAAGRVDTGNENRLHDMRVTLSPLYLDVLRDEMPDLPRASTLSGTLVLNGVPTGVLNVNGDLAIREPSSGESRFTLRGGIETGPLELHQLSVRMHPMQPALLAALGGPELPFGGLLEGTAVLTGSLEGRLDIDADVVHTEAGEVSHVLADGLLINGGRGETRVAMDVQLSPISLATLGRIAPAAGLQGTARGNLRVEGATNALTVRGQLELPGGSTVTGGGTVNAAGDVLAYDLDLALDRLDLSAVSARVREETDLSGNVRVVGRGTDLATMRTRVEADLVGSRVGDIPTADEVHLRLDLADGLARVEPSWIRLETAEARAEGSFGLVADTDGVLTYEITVDSLHSLAPWIPGADTAVMVPPRPAARAQAREEARVELARAMRAVQVERLATGTAPPEPSAIDTLPPPTLPSDSLAGSLRASGELRGNLTRFDAEGTARVENLIYQGSSVGSGQVTYQILEARSPAPDVSVEASLHSVLFRGLAYDSTVVSGTYAGGRALGSGRVQLTAWQDRDTELQGAAAFTFAEASKELRLEELRLRVDTVTWTNTGVGLVSWADGGTEIRGLELVSDAGSRVRVDGIVPKDGQADLTLLLENVEIAQVATLLQDNLGASGRLSLDGRLRGTRANPRFEGDASWAGATLRGTAIPDARGRITYAHSQLSADVELFQDGKRLAVAEARLPINLALEGVTGARLLDAAVSVNITADSLPLTGITGLTPGLANVQGALRGNFQISGTFDAPVLEGGGDLVGGYAEIPSLGIPLTDISGRVSLQDDMIRIDSLVGYARGPVRVTGVIDVASLREPFFDLEIEAREARVLDNDEGKLTVDADLTVRGPFEDVHVEGDVRTRRGVIYIPQLSEMGATDVVALDDPAVFERVDTLLAARRDLLMARHSFLSNLHVNVGVAIDRDVWLRSIETNVEIYTPRELGPIRLRVDGDRKALALEGTINTDRGEYEFMTRRFQLTRGAVTFLRGEDLNAILQVAAEHEVQLPGVEPFSIRALIGGTLRAPTITMESSAQPPISQTDLLTYVVFGRHAANLLPMQGSALSGQGAASGDLAGNVAALATQQLTTAAFGTLVNDLEGEAARSLGVDVFRITPAEMPEALWQGSFSTLLEGTEIEVGSYVRPRFFLAAQTRAASSGLGLTAEYATPRGLRWRMTWQQRFMPQEPTLGAQDPLRRRVLGMFLFREWRF